MQASTPRRIQGIGTQATLSWPYALVFQAGRERGSQNCQSTRNRGSDTYEQKYPVRTAAVRCCPIAGLPAAIFFTTALIVRHTLMRARSAAEAALRLRRR